MTWVRIAELAAAAAGALRKCQAATTAAGAKQAAACARAMLSKMGPASLATFGETLQPERSRTMTEATAQHIEELRKRQQAPLRTRTDLKQEATRDVAGVMNALLADVFALYLKTKNFHWHMSGPHFRDYHLLLDEQSDQLFAMTDPIAERVRKVGGSTLRSIGHIARSQRVLDNDADYVEPLDMLAELRDDNKDLAARLREAHGVCDEHRDIATASLIEVWIDETERRTWFLFEASRGADSGGH
jgi:starvation-inducible DNA-binding protein